ncbi:SCO family protein [Steroidobacter flavus]|uniref:SCO family protein n=1 Tax=Steroidobacter flavus TaxID=1842136 RepID=A0ABV8SSA5_9GAMM
MNRPVEQTSQGPRSRKQIWILIGAFFAPLALAFLLYYGMGIRPTGTTNKGDLISPAVPLPEVELPGATDQTLAANALRGKWSMVFIGDGACDARCREALTLMRQTRLALGDKMERVQRVFLVTGNCCDQAYLEAEHDGLLLGRIDNPAGQTLLETFPDTTQAAGLGRIYLVDPLGNLMMKYEPGAPQKGLFEDLKKLLKLSHIG